jgi:hypothetical protein
MKSSVQVRKWFDVKTSQKEINMSTKVAQMSDQTEASQSEHMTLVDLLQATDRRAAAVDWKAFFECRLVTDSTFTDNALLAHWTLLMPPDKLTIFSKTDDGTRVSQKFSFRAQTAQFTIRYHRVADIAYGANLVHRIINNIETSIDKQVDEYSIFGVHATVRRAFDYDGGFSPTVDCEPSYKLIFHWFTMHDDCK